MSFPSRAHITVRAATVTTNSRLKEFEWVSVNEAYRSTSLAASMKRLSWITVWNLAYLEMD